MLGDVLAYLVDAVGGLHDGLDLDAPGEFRLVFFAEVSSHFVKGGVHGVGGIAGAILTGVFASEAITGSAMKPVLEQVWIQTESVIATLIYASIVTYVLLKLVDVMIGIRVSAEEERMGLDLSLHGERVE